MDTRKEYNDFLKTFGTEQGARLYLADALQIRDDMETAPTIDTICYALAVGYMRGYKDGRADPGGSMAE